MLELAGEVTYGGELGTEGPLTFLCICVPHCPQNGLCVGRALAPEKIISYLIYIFIFNYKCLCRLGNLSLIQYSNIQTVLKSVHS